MKNTDKLKKQREKNKKETKRENNLLELNKIKQLEKKKGYNPYDELFIEFKKKNNKNKNKK